eukprot:631879-Rhodomonas_salina.1
MELQQLSGCRMTVVAEDEDGEEEEEEGGEDKKEGAWEKGARVEIVGSRKAVEEGRRLLEYTREAVCPCTRLDVAHTPVVLKSRLRLVLTAGYAARRRRLA